MNKRPSSELKAIRLPDFSLIPSYLLEQVKPRFWEPEDLYAWGNSFRQDPTEFIYGLVNDKREVKGILWFSVDPIIRGIIIEVLSVDPEYQDRKIGPKVWNFLKPIMETLGYKRVFAYMKHSKVAEREGWKRTGIELIYRDMEEEANKDGVPSQTKD